jgi:hypothetical protein
VLFTNQAWGCAHGSCIFVCAFCEKGLEKNRGFFPERESKSVLVGKCWITERRAGDWETGWVTRHQALDIGGEIWVISLSHSRPGTGTIPLPYSQSFQTCLHLRQYINLIKTFLLNAWYKLYISLNPCLIHSQPYQMSLVRANGKHISTQRRTFWEWKKSKDLFLLQFPS